jgi:hypothetical protein
MTMQLIKPITTVEILGLDAGQYEEFSLLECDAVYFSYEHAASIIYYEDGAKRFSETISTYQTIRRQMLGHHMHLQQIQSFLSFQKLFV